MSKLTYQQRGNQSTRIPVGQRRTAGGKALEDNRAAFAVKQLKQGETAQLTKEEDELLKGKSGTKQLAKKDEEEIGQAKFSDHGPPVQREQQPAKPNNTGLPDKLKNGIESLSGMSMDNVKVHYNSAKPQQLNALAYAQGTDIHVGPGQEKHLPHEAWHVVQQAQGRVRPTMQMKGGVAVNDDKGLEREADVMGEKVLGNTAQLQRESCALQSAWKLEAIQRLATPMTQLLTDGEGRDITKERIDDETDVEVLTKWKELAEDDWESMDLVKSIEERLKSLGEKKEPSEEEEIKKIEKKQEIVEEEHKTGEIVEQSDRSFLKWAEFKKHYVIKSEASKLIMQVGDTKILNPQQEIQPKSPMIAYVANLLTTPGGSVQKIIDNYAKGGISDYGSFAMVIGVNYYRSLDGTSMDKINETVATAQEAQFPCTVIPFTWDFDWGAPYKNVKAAFLAMDKSDQNLALAEEKEHLVQSIIPYGQLRERVTADEATMKYVQQLQSNHQAVYIHLGDDDAVSLPKIPLLDKYTKTILDKNFPPLVVGGYEFRTKQDDGDLNSESPGDVLTVIASQLDIWFRKMLTEIDSDLVYPTEPNMAFIASNKDNNFLKKMLEPNKQDKKLRDKQHKEALEIERDSLEGKEHYFSTGLLYGRGTNEGGKLRDNLKKKMKQEGKNFTFYNPNLGIPTASTRFTLRDEDHEKHDKKESTYGALRNLAFEKGGEEAYKAQIVHDLLTIKQSHIGGLKKEVENLDKKNKNAQKIADAVYVAVKNLMLGKDVPKPTEETELYINLILKHEKEIEVFRDKLNLIVKEMIEMKKK